MKLNATASTAPARGLADLAAGLERAGCQGLHFAELGHDPFIGAAAAAAGTTRMQLGTGIALAFPRSPATLAYTAWGLNTLTEGRFVLGLGTQIKAHIERRFGMTWSEPVKRMRETVLAIRAVWQAWQTGGPLAFDGEIYKLSLMPPAFRPEPAPFAPPPIYLAAVGPHMAEMAGEVADGLFVHAFATPAYIGEVLLPAVERGLRKSGRDRADFQLVYSAFIADADGPGGLDAALAEARNSVAFYSSTPDYLGVLDQHGLGGLQPRLRQLTREGAWDKMAAEIGDEVLDLFCVSGKPEELAAGLAKRWGSLVDQISLPVDYWTRHQGDPAWARAASRLRGEG